MLARAGVSATTTPCASASGRGIGAPATVIVPVAVPLKSPSWVEEVGANRRYSAVTVNVRSPAWANSDGVITRGTSTVPCGPTVTLEGRLTLPGAPEADTL